MAANVTVEAEILRPFVIDRTRYARGQTIVAPESWCAALRRELDATGKVRFRIGASLGYQPTYAKQATR